MSRNTAPPLIPNKTYDSAPEVTAGRPATTSRFADETLDSHDIFKRISGRTIAGKYRVKRVLKAGGMGLVVEAEHELLNKLVAIKMLLPCLVQDKQYLHRFIREAQATARLKSEHVARIMDVGWLCTGAPFVVMEYLDGVDLEDLLIEQGALPISLAVDIILQVSNAIGEAHSLGMVHRDLKPSNIFLLPRISGIYKVKVIDFGIVKDDGAIDRHCKGRSLTSSRHILGSPLYMPPEQLRDSNMVDQRADIWALGVILYECLTGQRPFDGDSAASLIVKVLQDEPRPVTTIGNTIPVGLASIIHCCLEKEPKDRFQSIEELRDALLDFATYESTAFWRARRDSIAPLRPFLPGGEPAEATSAELPLPYPVSKERPSAGPSPADPVPDDAILVSVHRPCSADGSASVSPHSAELDCPQPYSVEPETLKWFARGNAQGAPPIELHGQSGSDAASSMSVLAQPPYQRMPSLAPISAAHAPRASSSRRPRSRYALLACLGGALIASASTFAGVDFRPPSSAAMNTALHQCSELLVGAASAVESATQSRDAKIVEPGKPKDGILRVVTHPLPDQIFVDNKLWKGLLQDGIKVTPGVSHGITLIKTGYGQIHMQLELHAGESRPLTAVIPRYRRSKSSGVLVSPTTTPSPPRSPAVGPPATQRLLPPMLW